MPTEEEQAKWQRVIPIMNQLLQGKGLVKVAENKVLVTGLRGPLEEGWQEKVEAFVTLIAASPARQVMAARRYDSRADSRSIRTPSSGSPRSPRRSPRLA